MEVFRFFYIYRENILKYRSFHGKERKLIRTIMMLDFGFAYSILESVLGYY